jgi:hypothetical protein
MKPSIKFGLYTGILLGVWTISCFSIVSWLNHSMNLSIPARKIRAYSGLFSIVILVVGVYLAIKEAKRSNGNQIRYAEAVKTGVIVSVITGVVVAFFSYLYCTVINPGYADHMVKEAEQAMVAAHDTTEKISQQLTKVKQEFSTSSQVIMALAGQIIVGSICSLIIGIFVRSKKQS